MSELLQYRLKADHEDLITFEQAEVEASYEQAVAFVDPVLAELEARLEKDKR